MLGQVCKPKTLAPSSSKNTSFDSCTHYEDINVTSKEYALNGGSGGGGGECYSDGGGGVRRIKYPKVLPDFPAHGTPGCSSDGGKRLSLPPPLVAGMPEGAVKVPPPPPPRISSTLGRKKDGAKTEATIAMLPFRRQMTQPDTIPEEHKSPVVPCVPNQVCPATVPSVLPAKKPVEPRIVIKASSVQQPYPHQQPQPHQPQHPHQQNQQKQPKRTNIPRVVHPQNTDRNKQPAAVDKRAEGDTDTVKRKKK